ncbi:DUF2007 domain-containing protein [Myxococcus sp. RHSTA-1-4]|uniref:DUF2007 domain-containing protein n=1 Tax=Myxococcus sp. RHSTA-1-4 TaxID=2874601 RepID=UPI001CC18269|nr:DUF2007 domain-containing protein [Myxococcus sp. RHSTA-1-4]MBZ4416680.1 DUF2007 domain-containing protein [Myxococcus sp. RHSTA-1-4]
MKYCARCGSEYQDSVRECADCPGNPLLVSAEEMRARGLPLPHEMDKRVFVRAATAEDPFTAEAFVGVLQEANIPVLVRAGRSGVVDKLTTGNLLPWWEILVPEDLRARAVPLLEQERVQELATTDEAARAAEEEERETETPPSPPPAP